MSDEQSAQQRRLASAAHQRRVQQELHDNLCQLQVSFRTSLSAVITLASGQPPGSHQTPAAAAAAAAAELSLLSACALDMHKTALT